MADLAERLTNRIDVYGKIEFKNELEEKDYKFDKIKSVWSEIATGSGMLRTLPGNMSYANISHKITIRSKSIPNITNDMYFIFKGQRYDIQYFNPSYKYQDSIEIFCSLVVE